MVEWVVQVVEKELGVVVVEVVLKGNHLQCRSMRQRSKLGMQDGGREGGFEGKVSERAGGDGGGASGGC